MNASIELARHSKKKVTFLIMKRILVPMTWAIALACSAQTPKVKEAEEIGSARHFVQNFYNWYVVRASISNTIPAWGVALRLRSSQFNPKLANALRRDLAAQSRSKGEIVELDFDPFLNSQDPSDRYSVKKISRSGQTFRAEIVGASTGKPSAEPDIIAQLERRVGKWQFTNFLYPSGQNLLDTLTALDKSRTRN